MAFVVWVGMTSQRPHMHHEVGSWGIVDLTVFMCIVTRAAVHLPPVAPGPVQPACKVRG